MSAVFYEWGWLSAKDGEPQRWTFSTADAAIEAMQERVGKTSTLQDIARLGFKLCHVKVTIEPLLVLDATPDAPHSPQGGP